MTARSRLWPLKYAGLRYRCPICGWRLRRLGDGAGPFPAPDSVCPGCGSLERHRVLWLYLRDRIAAAGLRPHVEHLGERLTPAQLRRYRLIPAGGRPDDPSFTDVYVGAKPGPESRPPS